MKLLRLFDHAVSGFVPFGRRHCVMCNHAVWRFLPYAGGSARMPELMRELALTGSDVDNFECPRCGAHDRERHLLMYLRASGTLDWMRGKAILHFAPERRLSRVLAAAGAQTYMRCDLHPAEPGVERVDMLAMQFAADSFDLLMANHVLEHVDDDLRALHEIQRVLKTGGYAILQTPYSRKLQRTWSDAGIRDERSRLQAYGQEDHVRLYGCDIFERLTSTGLASRVREHTEILPDVDVRREGVNPDEPFFLFQKT